MQVWTPRLHVHTLFTLRTKSQPWAPGVHVGDVGWQEAGRGLGLFGQGPYCLGLRVVHAESGFLLWLRLLLAGQLRMPQLLSHGNPLQYSRLENAMDRGA